MGGRTGVLLVVLAVLAACEDAVAPGGEIFEGVAFTWDGGGEHRSSGPPSFEDGAVLSGEFAVAFPDSVGGLVMASFHPREGTKGNLFILQLVERGTGTFGPCGTSQECHGRFLEDLDPEDLSVLPGYWEITDGSVTIDVDGPGRLRGSFTDFVLSGPGDAGGVREIEEGTFDVPLLGAEQGADIMRCFIRRLTGGSCG